MIDPDDDDPLLKDRPTSAVEIVVLLLIIASFGTGLILVLQTSHR